MREICTSGSTRGRWAAIYLLPSVLLYRPPTQFSYPGVTRPAVKAFVSQNRSANRYSGNRGIHPVPAIHVTDNPAASRPAPNGFVLQNRPSNLPHSATDQLQPLPALSPNGFVLQNRPNRPHGYILKNDRIEPVTTEHPGLFRYHLF